MQIYFFGRQFLFFTEDESHCLSIVKSQRWAPDSTDCQTGQPVGARRTNVIYLSQLILL